MCGKFKVLVRKNGNTQCGHLIFYQGSTSKSITGEHNKIKNEMRNIVAKGTDFFFSEER